MIIKSLLVVSPFVFLMCPATWAENPCSTARIDNGPIEITDSSTKNIILQGQCSEGQLRGKLRYYTNGKLERQGQIENGKMTGRWTRYHQNGKIRDQGQWLNGQPEGLWQFYAEDGKPLAEEHFCEGKKVEPSDECLGKKQWWRLYLAYSNIQSNDVDNNSYEPKQDYDTVHLGWRPQIWRVGKTHSFNPGVGVSYIRDIECWRNGEYKTQSSVISDWHMLYRYRIKKHLSFEALFGLQIWQHRDEFPFAGIGLSFSREIPLLLQYRFLPEDRDLHQILIGVEFTSWFNR